MTNVTGTDRAVTPSLGRSTLEDTMTRSQPVFLALVLLVAVLLFFAGVAAVNAAV